MGYLGEGQAGAVFGLPIGGYSSGRARGTTPTRVWYTERVGRVIDFWVAFSDVVIIVRRLAREGWTRYRWEGRPSRRP